MALARASVRHLRLPRAQGTAVQTLYHIRNQSMQPTQSPSERSSPVSPTPVTSPYPASSTSQQPSYSQSGPIPNLSNATAATEPQRQNIYKVFGRPFAKVFLLAMFTYQCMYWGWEKMRLDEIRAEKKGEVEGLEGEVQRLKGQKGS